MATSPQLCTSGEALFLPDRQALMSSVDISSLFSAGVLTRCDHRDSWLDELTTEEQAQIGDVCEKRFTEFAAGRGQARQLVKALTGASESLPIGSFREPLWPRAVTGSISHSDTYCAVAVAPKYVLDGIGIDVEPFEVLDPEVADVVLTDLERSATAGLDKLLVQSGRNYLGGRAHKLIFSIKEAIYKCCHPRVQAFIDFKQCNVTLDLDTNSYCAVVDCMDRKQESVHLEIRGKWLISSGHIFASAELKT